MHRGVDERNDTGPRFDDGGQTDVVYRSTDSLGAHDAVDTYTTSGVWHVTFHDVANDEAKEAPGDRPVITIPIKGITITMSIDPTCKITVAPTAPAPIVGAYNDKNTLTITNAPVPITYSATGSPGCPGGNGSSTGEFSATCVLTPGMHAS